MQKTYKDWTVTFEDPRPSTLGRHISVTAVKGEESIRNTFKNVTSLESLRRQVMTWIDGLDAAAQVDWTAIELVEPAPPAPEIVEEPAAPTQAMLDQQQWNEDYELLKRMIELVDLGVYTGAEAPIVALRTKVKNNVKPEYLV